MANFEDKKAARKAKNKAIEEQRRLDAAAKRERRAQKVVQLTEYEQKIKAAAEEAAKEEAAKQAALNALPPKKFYFTIVTEIPGRVWERERALAYALTDEEADEHIKSKWIERLNSRPIRSCNVIEWGDYTEEE